MNDNYFFYREREQMRRAARIERLKTVICGLAFMAIVFGAVSIVGTYETHYTTEGVIIATSANEILVEDKHGNQWYFKGDGYMMGDNVRLTFFTNGTDRNKQDDELVKVKVIDK